MEPLVTVIVPVYNVESYLKKCVDSIINQDYSNLEIILVDVEKNNAMDDYFLLHDFMSIALDKYEDDWKQIVPRDNATPHILLLRLFDSYNEEMWQVIKEQTPFHKLTYKFDKEKTEINETYFKKILGGR